MHALNERIRRKGLLSPHGKMSNLSFINVSMLGVLAVVFLLASLIVPRFFSIATISNLIAQQAEIIILGVGVTFLLIAGYYDMSVGGVISMSAVLSAYFCQANTGLTNSLASGLGLPYGVSIALTLLACLGIGAFNAFFIVKMRLNSVVVTLGTMTVARGIAMITAKGSQRVVGLPPVYREIGQYIIVATLNIAVVIMLVVFITALIIEKKTRFGRRIFLIGANPEAARLSGVRVGRDVMRLYMLSALLAGITGIVMSSRFNAGNSKLGTGYEFDALVITVLGGTSVAGGFGSVTCVVIGAFILGILSTSVNMLGFQPDLQMLVKGTVIIASILAQRFALDKRSV